MNRDLSVVDELSPPPPPPLPAPWHSRERGGGKCCAVPGGNDRNCQTDGRTIYWLLPPSPPLPPVPPSQ